MDLKIKEHFSKIGTNPMKYFDNYLKYINNLPKGETLLINDLRIIYNNVVIVKFKSATTLRQNLDAWIWMHFIIKKRDNSLIKIIDQMKDIDLIEHIKYSLFLQDNQELVNKHRNTILIKLLTITDHEKQNFLAKCSREEILKECGEFEKILASDVRYIELVNKVWNKDGSNKK